MFRSRFSLRFFASLALPLVSFAAAGPLMLCSGQEATPEPWKPSEVITPEALQREMQTSQGKQSSVIIYVGFRTLYAGGHIPGAAFHGTASTPQGMAELKKWLETQPRSTSIVIYCGCCPFDKCPNIRPAYKAIRELGFARVRVVAMPASFAEDWVSHGYPMEKGS